MVSNDIKNEEEVVWIRFTGGYFFDKRCGSLGEFTLGKEVRNDVLFTRNECKNVVIFLKDEPPEYNIFEGKVLKR